MWPETRQYECETIVGVLTIATAAIGINRETKDLELRVAGEVQYGKDAPARQEYAISFPLWNYSSALKDKGISEEVYDEVMTKERDLLFAKYIRTWVILSDGATEHVTSRHSEPEKLRGIKYHTVVQELRNYQGELYIQLKMLQAKRERINRDEACEIQLGFTGVLSSVEQPEA
jgi:hypothetical protein